MGRVESRVRDQIAVETTFWENDPFERPGSDTLENLLNKAIEASIFRDAIAAFDAPLRAAHTIVEVGGGQGWASCIVKRLNPGAHVTLTDAVAAAVAGRSIWERAFACTLDGALAAPAQAIPLDDASVDLVFCYAAAHHFVDHDAALREAWRLLRPGGCCLWLYEPTSSSIFHRLAEARVNAKRLDVKEHVLVPSAIVALADAIGFRSAVTYWPHTLRRGRFESLYYIALSYVPVLARLLPCTAHFHFRKPDAAPAGGGPAA